jgi:hypothetical protein
LGVPIKLRAIRNYQAPLPQGDADLMTEKQVLGFKPAPRLEQGDDEHSK